MAIRKVSDRVMMETRWGRAVEQRSYLSELLDLANGTGRRISAICKLRYEDFRLNQGPYGEIRWPADTDKMGRETTVPIDQNVQGPLERVLRDRPGNLGRRRSSRRLRRPRSPYRGTWRTGGRGRRRSSPSWSPRRGACGMPTAGNGPRSASTYPTWTLLRQEGGPTP